jgi:alpha-glucosidase
MYAHFKRLLTFVFIVLATANAKAQKKISLASPDSSLVFSFQIVDGRAFYGVHYKGVELVRPSSLSLRIDGKDLGSALQERTPTYKDGVETYTLLAGKKKQVSDAYREMTIPIGESSSPFREVDLHVRIFRNAIAFRYEFPQKDSASFTLNEEQTGFQLVGDPIVRALYLPNYTSSHEGLYTTVHLGQIPERQLMDMPALFQFPSAYMAITEAALVDYAGMYLSKINGLLQSRLSPWPGDSSIKVKARLPHNSPWRVLLISDRIGDLVESTVITSLNAPCKLKEVSWIKPGKTTFPWWNGNVTPDTLNAPGNNFVTQQYYIDFCARNHIDYHSVVEYGLHQWYTDDGTGFQPGPHPDVTRPVPGLDMREVCTYAHSKGVGIRVWVHWAALYPQLDSAFAIFEKWGISGMMIDFMDRDDQQMVNIQLEMLQKAAAHHLHIQFHGAYKPTGINRTYPNELTREGTLNYENNKWSNEGLTPDHDLDVVFTRMLAGATDYHMGGFRAVPPAQYHAQYTRPLMLGTRAHMLGMYVVLESYLGMVCDYPAAYEGQPGFDFVQAVPTTWDDTKVLSASVGQYALIARRSGTNWFIGGINNHEARTLTIRFSFLDGFRYRVKIYRDGPNVSTDANALLVSRQEIGRNESLQVKMAAGGGVAIMLEKIL